MKKTAAQIAGEVLEKVAISVTDLDRIALVAKSKLVRPPRTPPFKATAMVPLHRGRGAYWADLPPLPGEPFPVRAIERGPQAFVHRKIPEKIFVRRNAHQTNLQEVRDLYTQRIERARQGLLDHREVFSDRVPGQEVLERLPFRKMREMRDLREQAEAHRRNLRSRLIRDVDTLNQIDMLGFYRRPLTPYEQRYSNYLTQAHELDELALNARPQHFVSHNSPDVIFRESNRVATLPPELRQVGIEEKALRVGTPEGAMFERIRAKYPQLGVGRYGEKRINRRLRRFLTEEQAAGRLLE